jgi:hypothetical protein
MTSGFRQTIFTLFAVFYIVSLPFLIILSLGYDFDLQSKNLDNTLTVKVETIPRGANIPFQSKEFVTPTEFRTSDGVSFTMDIRHTGYLSDRFTISGKKGVNSIARIDKLRMLPEKVEYSQESKSGTSLVSILSPNYTLVKKQVSTSESVYAIQSMGIGGFQGEPEIIAANFNRQIEFGWWIELYDNVFWNRASGYVLYQIPGSKWQVFDLYLYEQEFVSIIRVNNKRLLALDTAGALWTLDLETTQIGFVDSGYSGLSFSQIPDAIWFWKENKLYREDRASFDPSDFPRASSLFYQFNKNFDTFPSFNGFSVQAVYFGLSVKLDNQLYYLPDANNRSYMMFTDDAKFFGSYENVVFWITSDNKLFAYHLNRNTTQSLGRLSLEDAEMADIRLVYNLEWSRLFIYTETKVHSVWYSGEFQNQAIVGYYPILWVDNSQCLSELISNNQFCIQPTSLLVYRNNNVAF